MDVWYVYRGDHHEGPFDPDQLEKMLEKEEISEESLTWREGMESWIPLKENEDLSYIVTGKDEFPPPLPVEEFDEVEDDISLQHDKIKKERLDSPEEEKTEIIQLSNEDRTKDHGDFETYKTYRNSFNGKLARIPWRKVGRWSLGGLAIAVVAISLFLIFWDEGEVPSYIGLIQIDRDRLAKMSLSEESLDLKVRFALGKDRKNLWMALNRKSEAQVHLKMVAMKGKVLSSDKIVLTSKGKMKRGVTHFAHFKMEQGVSLIPGAYRVEFFGYYTGLKNKAMLFLQNLGFLNFLYLIKDYSPKFDYRSDLLIISGSKSDFQKKLKKYLGKVHSKKVKPLQDMVERYRTYNALLERVLSIYKEKLKKFRTPYSIVKSFEKDYAKQVAPLLKFILLDNNKIHIYLVDSDAVIAGEYEMLLTFGKQVGELVSDMSVDTKKHRTLTRFKRKKLRDLFEFRVKKLEELSASRLSKLEKRLAKWKNSI